MPSVAEPMTSLRDWLGPVANCWDVPVRDIHLDSRQVGRGDAFVAVSGERSDGFDYAADAVARGAVAILVEDEAGAPRLKELGVPVVALTGLRSRLGQLARRFYADATADLHLIGVTGTNGKTSVSWILAQLLESLGERCAVVGTLGWGFVDALQDTGMTTPDVVSVHRILANLARAEAAYVAMEVSSHGLSQGRVDEVDFNAAVFTNLSRDHLDYHGDMASYEASKRSLFLQHLELAVFNIDDAAGARLYRDAAIGCRKLSYSLHDSGADVYCGDVRYHAGGCAASLVTPWGEGQLQSPLLGHFNLLNLLSCLTVLAGLGFDLPRLLHAVSSTVGAPGRLESVCDQGGVHTLVDYAHTPDALEQVLIATRPHVSGCLWLVFGCGGNRDRGKRPLMGALAERLADKIILTSDNPRDEDAELIIEEIRGGFESDSDPLTEPDRRRAIEWALASAAPGDVVIVAGKGHESYQEICGERTPFSDRECVERFYQHGPGAGR